MSEEARQPAGEGAPRKNLLALQNGIWHCETCADTNSEILGTLPQSDTVNLFVFRAIPVDPETGLEVADSFSMDSTGDVLDAVASFEPERVSNKIYAPDPLIPQFGDDVFIENTVAASSLLSLSTDQILIPAVVFISLLVMFWKLTHSDCQRSTKGILRTIPKQRRPILGSVGGDGSNFHIASPGVGGDSGTKEFGTVAISRRDFEVAGAAGARTSLGSVLDPEADLQPDQIIECLPISLRDLYQQSIQQSITVAKHLETKEQEFEELVEAYEETRRDLGTATALLQESNQQLETAQEQLEDMARAKAAQELVMSEEQNGLAATINRLKEELFSSLQVQEKLREESHAAVQRGAHALEILQSEHDEALRELEYTKQQLQHATSWHAEQQKAHCSRVHELDAMLTDTDSQLRAARDEISDLQSKHDALSLQNEFLRQLHSTSSEASAKLQENQHAMNDMIAKLQLECSDLRSKVSEQSRELETTAAELVEECNAKVALENECEELRKNVAWFESNTAELQASHKASLTSHIDEHQREQARLQEALHALQVEGNALQQALEAKDKALEEASAEKLQLSMLSTAQAAEIVALQESLRKSTESIAILEKSVQERQIAHELHGSELNKYIVELQSKVDTEAARCRDLQQRFESAQAEWTEQLRSVEQDKQSMGDALAATKTDFSAITEAHRSLQEENQRLNLLQLELQQVIEAHEFTIRDQGAALAKSEQQGNAASELLASTSAERDALSDRHKDALDKIVALEAALEDNEVKADGMRCASEKQQKLLEEMGAYCGERDQEILELSFRNEELIAELAEMTADKALTVSALVLSEKEVSKVSEQLAQLQQRCAALDESLARKAEEVLELAAKLMTSVTRIEEQDGCLDAAHTEMDVLKEIAVEREMTILQLREEAAVLKASIEVKDAELVRAADSLVDGAAGAAALQKVIAEEKQARSAAESSLDEMAAKCAQLSSQLDESAAAFKAAEEAATNLEEQNRLLSAELSDETRLKEKLEQQVKSELLRVSSLEADCSAKDKKIEELTADCYQLANDVKVLQAELDASSGQVAALEEKLVVQENEALERDAQNEQMQQELRASIESLNEQVESLVAAVNAQNEEIQTLRHDLQEAKQTVASQEALVQQSEQVIQSLKEERASQQAMMNEHEHSHKAAVDQLETEAEARTAQIEDLQRELEYRAAEVDKVIQIVSFLNAQIEEKTRKSELKDQTLAQLEEQLAFARSKLKEETELLMKLQKDHKYLQDEHHQLNTETKTVARLLEERTQDFDQSLEDLDQLRTALMQANFRAQMQKEEDLQVVHALRQENAQHLQQIHKLTTLLATKEEELMDAMRARNDIQSELFSTTKSLSQTKQKVTDLESAISVQSSELNYLNDEKTQLLQQIDEISMANDARMDSAIKHIRHLEQLPGRKVLSGLDSADDDFRYSIAGGVPADVRSPLVSYADTHLLYAQRQEISAEISRLNESILDLSQQQAHAFEGSESGSHSNELELLNQTLSEINHELDAKTQQIESANQSMHDMESELQVLREEFQQEILSNAAAMTELQQSRKNVEDQRDQLLNRTIELKDSGNDADLLSLTQGTDFDASVDDFNASIHSIDLEIESKAQEINLNNGKIAALEIRLSEERLKLQQLHGDYSDLMFDLHEVCCQLEERVQAASGEVLLGDSGDEVKSSFFDDTMDIVDGEVGGAEGGTVPSSLEAQFDRLLEPISPVKIPPKHHRKRVEAISTGRIKQFLSSSSVSPAHMQRIKSTNVRIVQLQGELSQANHSLIYQHEQLTRIIQEFNQERQLLNQKIHELSEGTKARQREGQEDSEFDQESSVVEVTHVYRRISEYQQQLESKTLEIELTQMKVSGLESDLVANQTQLQELIEDNQRLRLQLDEQQHHRLVGTSGMDISGISSVASSPERVTYYPFRSGEEGEAMKEQSPAASLAGSTPTANVSHPEAQHSTVAEKISTIIEQGRELKEQIAALIHSYRLPDAEDRDLNEKIQEINEKYRAKTSEMANTTERVLHLEQELTSAKHSMLHDKEHLAKVISTLFAERQAIQSQLKDLSSLSSEHSADKAGVSKRIEQLALLIESKDQEIAAARRKSVDLQTALSEADNALQLHEKKQQRIASELAEEKTQLEAQIQISKELRLKKSRIRAHRQNQLSGGGGGSQSASFVKNNSSSGGMK